MAGRFWVFLMIATLFGFCPTGSAAERSRERCDILLITSSDSASLWNQNVLRGVSGSLALRKCADSIAVAAVAQLEKSGNSTRRELAGGKYNIVIALDREAVRFVLRNADALPADCSVICLLNADDTMADLRSAARFTGIQYPSNVGRNFELGMSLFPGTREVLILCDPIDDNAVLAKRLETRRRNYPQVNIRVVSGDTSAAALLDTVRALPPDSFVILQKWYRNGGTERLDEVWKIALAIGHGTRIPLLVTDDSLMGYGAIGGWMTDGVALGRQAGATVERILSGEEAGRIPWSTLSAQSRIERAELAKYQSDLSARTCDTVWRAFWEERHDVLNMALALVAGCLLGGGAIWGVMRYRRRRLVGIFNSLPSSIGVTGLSLKNYYVFGHAEADIIGYPFFRKDVPAEASAGNQEFRRNFVPLIAEVIERQEPKWMEFRQNQQRMRCRIFPLPAGILPEPGVFWLTDNVEELLEERDEAQRALAWNNRIFSALNEAIIVSDRNQNIAFMNSTATQMLGEADGVNAQRSILDVVHLRRRGTHEEFSPVDEVLLSGKTIMVGSDAELILPDGTVLPISGRAVPLLAEGEVEQVVLTLWAVAGLEAELEQRNSELMLYKEMSSYEKIVCFEADSAGKLLSLSSGDRRFWPLDNDGGDIFAADAQMIRDDWARLFSGRIGEIVRIFRRGEMASPSYFRLRARLKRNRDGAVLSCCGVVQDMTVINQIETQLKRHELLLHFLADRQGVSGCPGVGDQIDAEKLLMPLARILNAERCVLLRFEDNYATALREAEWLIEGLELPSHPAEYNMRNFGEMVNSLLRHEPAVGGEGGLPWPNEWKGKSQICVGVWSDGRLWGCLALDFIIRREEPDQMDILIAGAVSQMISGVLRTRRLTDELAIQKEFAHQLSDSEGNLFLLFDANGKLLHVNRYICELLNKTEAELVAEGCGEVCGVVTRPQNCPLELSMKDLLPHVANVRERLFRVIVMPVRDRGGEIIYYIESGIDITELQEYQRALSSARESVQQQESGQGSFFETVCLSLRRPLNSLISFSSMLDSGDGLNATQHDYLNEIKLAGGELTAFLERLQITADLKVGNLVNRPAPVDCGTLFRELNENYRGMFGERGTVFQLEAVRTIPKLIFDAKLFQMALGQLCSYYLRMANKGRIEVQAQFVPFQQDGGSRGELLVSVHDAGHNLSPEKSALLRELLSVENKVPPEGMEQELWLLQQLVSLMNGKVGINSIERVGTIIEFYFDVKLCVEAENVSAVVCAGEGGNGNLVLVVDDNVANVKLFSAMLRRLEVDFMALTSAAAAIEIARSRDVKLILTDVWMHEMTGDEMAAELAKNPVTASIPVVAVTADTQIREGVFRAVLYKPLKLQELKSILTRFCGA